MYPKILPSPFLDEDDSPIDEDDYEIKAEDTEDEPEIEEKPKTKARRKKSVKAESDSWFRWTVVIPETVYYLLDGMAIFIY